MGERRLLLSVKKPGLRALERLSRPRSEGDTGERRPLLSVSHGEWVVKVLREGDEGYRKVLEHVSLASCWPSLWAGSLVELTRPLL